MDVYREGGGPPGKAFARTLPPFRANRGARPCRLMALDRRGLGADFDGLKCRGLRAWGYGTGARSRRGRRFERTAGGVATARKESADVGRHRQGVGSAGPIKT